MKKYKVIKKRPGGPDVGSIGLLVKHLDGGYVKIDDKGYDIQGYIGEYREEVKESKVPCDIKKLKKMPCRRVDSNDGQIESGYYDGDDVNICIYRPTEKLAQASLAMSQLAQLRNETRRRCDHWKPDWADNSKDKSVIFYYRGEVILQTHSFTQCFLAFPTYEISKEFLVKHRDLIEQAKGLL